MECGKRRHVLRKGKEELKMCALVKKKSELKRREKSNEEEGMPRHFLSIQHCLVD